MTSVSEASDLASRRRRSLGPACGLFYGLVLVASWLTLLLSADHARPAPGGGDQVVELESATADAVGGTVVEMVFSDLGPRNAPCVVLIHGSPGSLQDFRALAESLAETLRVVVPDLPGFGRSQRGIADYSARAHARYLVALLDRLGIERAHLVAFSMGGAVALECYDVAAPRVRSLAMVAALGVVEHELFGDPRMNHLVHGAQLGAIQFLRFALPHFGTLDRFALNVPYARNFYDTDQTRLRPLLERFEPPLLILHGVRDFLVPIAAAREHHRLVPQSTLLEREASHFLLWTEPEFVATTLREFVAAVESGVATTRASASPERIAQAAAPPEPHVPRTLFTELLLAALLAVATFVSEDLTCVGAGLLIAAERMSVLGAVLGCSIGIFVGDIGLFVLGRIFVRPMLEGRVASRFVARETIERGSRWLRQHDGKAILLSRFMPGLRLPTYLAAGALGMPFLRFVLLFLLAASLWTPLLVLGAAWLGQPVLAWIGQFGAFAPWLLLGAALAIAYLLRILVSLFTWRGRRLLLGRIRRITRFEFWPPWAFYPPVIVRLAALAVKHGGFGTVTAANPGIEHGGFIGESKARILQGLSGAGEAVACHALVLAAWPGEQRIAFVRRFMEGHSLDLPIVLKPDVGQRGSGVQIVRDEAHLHRFLETEMLRDHVVQEYVPGVEYGIFYVRHPSEPVGRIISITEKQMPHLIGDGARTLEDLILADPRAVCVAETYFERNRARLSQVPASGERCQLVELGTHCRGAVFRDGAGIHTKELAAAIDRIGRSFDGFYFGRFDIRAADREAFRRGDSLKVIELNGVTAEATHIYDPNCPLREAYRVLFEQWRIAFEIGQHNKELGAATTSVLGLLKEFVRYRRSQRTHSGN